MINFNNARQTIGRILTPVTWKVQQSKTKQGASEKNITIEVIFWTLTSDFLQLDSTDCRLICLSIDTMNVQTHNFSLKFLRILIYLNLYSFRANHTTNLDDESYVRI